MSRSSTAADGPGTRDAFIGRVIDGRFRIEAKLGAGGLGTVYRACHVRVSRPVAVKVLHAQYAANKTLIRRFEREARSLGVLQHPAIVDVIDYGVDGAAPYLVMELLQGRPLDQAIREGLGYERALAVFREAVSAVAFAHAQSVIHRDLKPANVFLQQVPNGPEAVRVLDFGLAKFTDDAGPQSTALTQAGSILGTPAYMSPEQASGAPTDATTDVYALGIMLFELLTAERPFRGDVSDLFRQHMLADLPSLATVRADLPRLAALDALLAKATTKPRKQRLQSASELLAALDEVLATDPEPAQPAAGAPVRASALPTRAERPASVASSQVEQDADPAVDVATAATLAAIPVQAYVPSTSQASASNENVAAHVNAAADVPTPPAETLSGVLQSTLASAHTWMRRARRGPRLAAGAAALVVVVGIAAIGGGNEEATSSQPAAIAKAAAPAQTAPPQPAKPAASVNMLAELPDALTQVRDAQPPGARLSLGTRRRVFRWQRAHPEDVRGWLLMADLDVQWGARSDAMRWYGKALKADPDAARSASMQRNLVRMAGHGKVGHRAQGMIRELWGAAALPWIDAALQQGDLDRDERRRLQRFRAALEE